MNRKKEHFEVPVDEIRQITKNKETPSLGEIEKLVSKSLTNELTLDEVNKLINVIGMKDFNVAKKAFIECATAVRKSIFNGSVVAMAPIELGNVCASNCDFCGWRSDNKKMERSRTPIDIARAQAEYLIKKGIYSIEYVCGDDPKLIREVMPDLIQETRALFPDKIDGADGGGKIQVCTMALTTKQYEDLKEAGADGIIMWQETYDKNVYDKHITKGPKAHGINDNWKVRKGGDGFEFRLQSQDRALEAGLEVSVGTMLGLNQNTNFEVLATIIHARHLIEKMEREGSSSASSPLIVGMPTWNKITTPETDNRPSQHKSVKPYFAYIAALYFLSIPRKKAWIFPNCRMPMNIQVEAARAGGVYTSTEVKLGPAGYIPQMLREASKNDRQDIIDMLSEQMGIKFDSIADLEKKLDHQEQFKHHYHTHQEYVEAFNKEGLNIVAKAHITPEDTLEQVIKYARINFEAEKEEESSKMNLDDPAIINAKKKGKEGRETGRMSRKPVLN